VSIFLIVVGAILTFALHATVAGNRRRVPRAVLTERRTYDDAGQPPL
jgi:hypothetical protein